MKLPSECKLPSIDSIRLELLAALEQTDRVRIDASGVETADVSFVQLIVSASQSAARAGKAVMLAELPEPVRSLFLRAGLDVDPSGSVVNA